MELPKFRALRDAVVDWSADLAVAQAGGLPQAATAAQERFEPIAPAEDSRTKAALEAALGKLDKYLSGANGQAWRTFLRWDDLQKQLASPSPSLDELAGVYERFTSDNVGLEMPVFSDVTTALDRYISVVAAQRDEMQEQFRQHLASLAEDLTKYANDHSEDLSESIGAKLGWLQRTRQARGLVRAVRREYSHPNLQVAASARLVAAGLEQDVDDTAPVRDYILGTDISGTGHTMGKVSVQLVPSEDAAVLDIQLKGKTSTRTVGYNGPATIYTNSDVQIAGGKRVLLDASGFKSYPATGTAEAKTKITGIGAKRKIVQKIATRRAAEQKPEAERIGSDHAAARVRGRVEEQSGTQLSKAHADYVQKFRNPLMRRREFPELLQFRTTEDALYVTGLKANRMQLAAPDNPPDIDGQHDLVVRVHESMINNMAAALLSGVTIREAEMQKQVIELRGELPDKLKSDPDQDPWSITFARVRPVSIKFADDGFKVTIRGQRYTSGDRNFRAMDVTAEYKVQIDGPGAKLVRQGDLVIVPPNFVPGKSRLSSQQITLRTLLERRFGKMFEPEIKSEGLELPGAWKNAGRLDLKVLQSKAGWLALAWIESGEPVKGDESAEGKDKVAVANR